LTGVDVLSAGAGEPFRIALPATDVRWLPDSRRIMAGTWFETMIWAFDVEARQRLGTLLPSLSDNESVTIGPDGHYRGSWRIDEHLVYVALNRGVGPDREPNPLQTRMQ